VGCGVEDCKDKFLRLLAPCEVVLESSMPLPRSK
jgi:hypothetical protein